jgi:ketol-acid reductoisomerase
MDNYIYTLLIDTYVYKGFDSRLVDEVITSTNYNYYTSLPKAVEALNEQLEKTKRWIQEGQFEIEWEHHENIGSPSEFYYIKLKDIKRPIGIYITPLELCK